tara:strand:- start:454 stop:684 length:231 start_codon:yes stop_codon:yes gene_type:complete
MYTYTVNYEGLSAYSSPRKAIEYVQKAYPSATMYSDGVRVDEKNTEKLIAELNKENFILLDADYGYSLEITKLYVN